ncbi:helix-turn-helix domain-containing protein [Natronosporangium hydrolyticum]|nr:helix-turn-helix transcriptional regulator [Natronosporangium hydrolyticum]
MREGNPRRADTGALRGQAELARQAGMTQSAVARFETGGTVPTLPVLERLARALGVELAVTFSPRAAAQP